MSPPVTESQPAALCQPPDPPSIQTFLPDSGGEGVAFTIRKPTCPREIHERPRRRFCQSYAEAYNALNPPKPVVFLQAFLVVCHKRPEGCPPRPRSRETKPEGLNVVSFLFVVTNHFVFFSWLVNLKSESTRLIGWATQKWTPKEQKQVNTGCDRRPRADQPFFACEPMVLGDFEKYNTSPHPPVFFGLPFLPTGCSVFLPLPPSHRWLHGKHSELSPSNQIASFWSWVHEWLVQPQCSL